MTATHDAQVVAYYAWTMASVRAAEAPARASRGVGRHPQPFALLARLTVDIEHEGHGLGAALVVDAVTRTVALSQEIGCRGLLVHCEDEQAANFYRHILPGFESSPTDPLHLMVLSKDLRRALSGP